MSQIIITFRHAAIAVLLASLSATTLAQITYTEVPQATIDSRLNDVDRKNDDREAKLKALFESAGCGQHISLQPVKGSKLQNVICILPGETQDQVIVAAHFDKVEDGMGVVDNWSGASLLPSLYEGLARDKRKHTLVFIGFADEEKGMAGSKFYVKSLSREDRSRIHAMIYLDTLGLGHTEVWVATADKTLTAWAAAIAKWKQLPLTGMDVGAVGDTDSSSFSDVKIPAITFHSLTQETLPILHSARDTMKAIKKDDFYASYRFLVAYVAVVDVKADANLREEKKK